MSATALYFVLLALSAPWWWSVCVALLRDVSRAGDPLELSTPRVAQHARATPLSVPLSTPLSLESSVPLNRVLAFRGRAQHVRARHRWEGGFGRRGL